MWRLVLLLVALVEFASSVENSHKVFRIKPENNEQLAFLRSFENDKENRWSFWKEPTTVSQPADLMVSPAKLTNFSSLMNSRKIPYECTIENVEALLTTKPSVRQTRSSISTFGWTRYHTLEEINAWMDSLTLEFPSIVQPIVGGRTYEGRQIRGVKLSFCKGKSKLGIFIEGGIHASEWISHATVTFLVNQLLRSQDPQVRALAEAHDWYVIPVFNPDGYAYSHLNVTNVENRTWRKTRTTDAKGCVGTDMNRNWGFQWNTTGTSNDPCSWIYSGSAAFSTVEAKTLSQYISSLSGKLFAYLSFHSYAQLLMFPYGYTKEHLDNYDEELAIAEKAIAALSRRYGTKYKAGTIPDLLRLASGSSIDWVKANLKLPLVYVYELRDTGNVGLLLPAEEIIPTSEEVLDSLVALFQEAEKYGYPSR